MNTAIKQPDLTNNLKSSGNSVICKKCKSNQVVANKRGYSFGLMLKVLFSMIGVGVAGLVIVTLSLEFGHGIELFYGIGVVMGFPLFLSLPTALLCGFIGRNNIMNGCMNCGNKWLAGKK
jgi:hypothetical protein